MSERTQGVRVDLADEELHMLVRGLTDWGAPAVATERLSVAMGFTSIEDLLEEGSRLAEALAAGQPLSVRDWTRALVATEIAFASDVFGTGSEWTVVQGGSDEQWIVVLRKLQAKVPVDRRFLDPRADLEEIRRFDEAERMRQSGGSWQAYGPDGEVVDEFRPPTSD
jgi:hypothetical protein